MRRKVVECLIHRRRKRADEALKSISLGGFCQSRWLARRAVLAAGGQKGPVGRAAERQGKIAVCRGALDGQAANLNFRRPCGWPVDQSCFLSPGLLGLFFY
jgi:hypothetical protein